MALPELKYLVQQTKNGQVGYSTIGIGQPLILVVGYSGTLCHWNAGFIEGLSKYYTLYMIDNRKIGLSDSLNASSILGFATDIIDFIEAKKLYKPLILGWSMGGVIAQEILRSYSGVVYGAILFASIPSLEYVKYNFVSLLMNAHEYSEDEYKALLYGFFFSEKPKLGLKDYITNYLLNFDNYPYRFNDDARDLQHLAISSWSGMSEIDLQAINAPVLILKARDDLVVEDSSGDFFVSNLANAKLVVYPRGGHFLVHSSPDEIVGDIYNFFH